MSAVPKSRTHSRHLPPRRLVNGNGGNLALLPRTRQANSSSRGRSQQPHLQPVSRHHLTAMTSAAQPVSKLADRRSAPVWLQSLILVQKGSSVLMLGLVTSALAVYGWTVHSQQLWSQEYQRLETLQRSEWQFTTANEVLKNQMAQQAEKPEAGLTLSTPDHTVFMQPAPPRPAVVPPSPVVPAPFSSGPIGY